MDFAGAGFYSHGGARATHVIDGASPAVAAAPLSSSRVPPPSLDDETMWQMSLRGGETMESGTYPERPGQPDCAYYIRTGLCRFGMTCKFNHPPNRNTVIATARIMGEYPERVGQPECQYYLKTGTCKFGATCKFHHPKDKAAIAGRVQLNIMGYPLRADEKECTYYLRTGQCKFGSTCKFHHPQPSNAMVSLRGSVYPPVHSPTNAGQQSYAGGLTSWPMSRASFITSQRWQAPSSFAQLILPQGMLQVSGWNTYPGPAGSTSPPESQQQSLETSQIYGSSRQIETSSGARGAKSSYKSGSLPMSMYALQRENVFPERPGEPECQFYMKTGDCKFGAVCRFHHPRERLLPAPNCALSPLGLPLRPEQPPCVFYSRYGICKFGTNCKFNHPMVMPMGPFTYSVPATSPDFPVPVMHHILRSSSESSPQPMSPPEGPAESAQGNSRRPSISESRQMSSGDEDLEGG